MNSNLPERDAERGQVGIGTLIVFIAMVLVAAIAAGVLINTAGFLQSKSEATGQESTRQTTNRIAVTAATGNVNAAGDAVEIVNVTVARGSGAANIDLENTTVQWVGPSGTYKLVADSVGDTNDDGVMGTNADGTFNVSAFKDADGSVPVLNSADDRFVVTFDVGNNNFSADEGGGPAYNTSVEFSDPLPSGSEVQLTMTTRSSASVTRVLVVPQSLSGKEAVSL